MTTSPTCAFFAGVTLEECLAGTDHGGHSRGKYF